MLSNAQRFLSSALWLVVAPGACIFSTVLGLYLVADGLRDALDPVSGDGGVGQVGISHPGLHLG